MSVKTRVLASRILIRLEQHREIEEDLGIKAALKEASSNAERTPRTDCHGL